MPLCLIKILVLKMILVPHPEAQLVLQVLAAHSSQMHPCPWPVGAALPGIAWEAMPFAGGSPQSVPEKVALKSRPCDFFFF